MAVSDTIFQDPPPGQKRLCFKGDTITLRLHTASAAAGSAWVRTDLAYARAARREIIQAVTRRKPILSQAWFDIPMHRVGDRHFEARLALCDVGHFEAKSFFLPAGAVHPVWPPGPNLAINVAPPQTCCANIIYNAFVRQFGPTRAGAVETGIDSAAVDRLDRAGYTVIPPSGKFRDLIRELDFIVGELGCRFIQLLPVNPTPTTYGRMGRFGSPYAALSFTAVDPALAEFDPKATPLEQFIELVDAVHARRAKVLIDLAINHTGWAAGLHETHPEWLVRDPQGRIAVPGAWGVRWEDLTKLDYSRQGLWRYMADVFLTWCRRGVDGFRCDAGYMIPVEAWRYIVATVRDQFPDTVFLLEGLGGKITTTRAILDSADFNWAYSELFQNYDRQQIESYLPQALEISAAEGLAVHFAETHDNNRLAARSRTYARMRTALCALCAPQGAFGFANGVEWFAAEKINVHQSPSLNWGAEPNQVAEIRRLNTLLKTHPAFFGRTDMRLITAGPGNSIALLRRHPPSGKNLLVAANLDDQAPQPCAWRTEDADWLNEGAVDLLSGRTIVLEAAEDRLGCRLAPGEVLCLSAAPEDLDNLQPKAVDHLAEPERILRQRLRAKALEVRRHYYGIRHLGDFDPDTAARRLLQDPSGFCRSQNPLSGESRVTVWQAPVDLRRTVMLPPGRFLLVLCAERFCARIRLNTRCLAQEESFPNPRGGWFALFAPPAPPKRAVTGMLQLSCFEDGGCAHRNGPLRLLPLPEEQALPQTFRQQELHGQPLFLDTNGRGGMLRAPVPWAELYSKYDTLLAANLHPGVPQDRIVLLTRCRAWVVYQGYSQEVRFACLDRFQLDAEGKGVWRFRIPSGQGEHIVLVVRIAMVPGENTVQMTFVRRPAGESEGRLADACGVELILRPDIEDRSFHETTKAYLGPEHTWDAAVHSTTDGFRFSPGTGRTLSVNISAGVFVREPEWHYMVYRPLDAERGMDPDSDLFSPGYFSAPLRGGEEVLLTAAAETKPAASVPGTVSAAAAAAPRGAVPPETAMRRALDAYIVRRGRFKTVIAGYPWFLDWGRDTLIFVRGLIAAGRLEESRAMLQQFAAFEDRGTIPNMIRGHDTGNRETSDAPLWLVRVCAELMAAEGDDAFLSADCGGRPLIQVLRAIGRSIMTGASNGVRMDPHTGLVFSPAHFTWMDTNYPAGSPRRGYPVEIQALWHAALSFLDRVDNGAGATSWAERADQVRRSLCEFYPLPAEGFLADCLMAEAGQSARTARPADHLRPNQLLAVTLGALDDPGICRGILETTETLLVPGAVRSLADRPVAVELPVVHDGALLNDPKHPYQGRYEGDEDRRRKPAYHNGTAWTWLFPSFCEAYADVYGPPAADTALAWLTSSFDVMFTGAIGHIPEILDGDAPHRPRGCDAQAWGVSELLRVWLKLKKIKAAVAKKTVPAVNNRKRG